LPHRFHGYDLAQFGVEILLFSDDIVAGIGTISALVIDPETHHRSADHPLDGDAETVFPGLVRGQDTQASGGFGLDLISELIWIVFVFPGPAPLLEEPPIKPFHCCTF